MFGGIVETIGDIIHITHENDCVHFTIAPRLVFNDVVVGDSVAVNGVCLTVTAFSNNQFNVTAVPETLRLTNLGNLKEKDLVNLERSLKLNARVGGHIVQGHVDGVGEIIEINSDGKNALLVKFRVPASLTKYIIKKGYVGIDGMSLTVVDVNMDWFTITLIPHTQEVTIASRYKINSQVNIEVDILGKYIEKLVKQNQDQS